MGTFFTHVQIASPRRADRREAVKLLVDSGSVYTWISGTALRDLGVQPTDRRRVVTIEGRTTERGVAEILVTLEGRTLHTLCLFGEPGDLEVLGAYTLEGFGLAIDPVQRRLVPAIIYGGGSDGRECRAHRCRCLGKQRHDRPPLVHSALHTTSARSPQCA